MKEASSGTPGTARPTEVTDCHEFKTGLPRPQKARARNDGTLAMTAGAAMTEQERNMDKNDFYNLLSNELANPKQQAFSKENASSPLSASSDSAYKME